MGIEAASYTCLSNIFDLLFMHTATNLIIIFNNIHCNLIFCLKCDFRAELLHWGQSTEVVLLCLRQLNLLFQSLMKFARRALDGCSDTRLGWSLFFVRGKGGRQKATKSSLVTPSIVPLNHTDSQCNYDLLHPLACKCAFIMAHSGLSDSEVRLYRGKVPRQPQSISEFILELPV